MYKCQHCKKELEEKDTYEYRGSYSCSDHFDLVCGDRDRERQRIIEEEKQKTEMFRGLDISSDTKIGKANREILKTHIEIASKESTNLKNYEGRKLKR